MQMKNFSRIIIGLNGADVGDSRSTLRRWRLGLLARGIGDRAANQAIIRVNTE